MSNFNLYFKAICGGYDSNFSYIISAPKEGKLALIDASISWDSLQTALQKAYREGYSGISDIFLTHSHHDHIAYLSEIYEKTKAKIHIHKNAKNKMQNYEMPINYIDQENILSFASESIQVIHTPGHQPDCLCFIWHNKIFTGDTLFIEGCGRCDFPESSIQDQFESLTFIANELPDHLEVHAGHDYGSMPVSTIGREKQENKYLKDIVKEKLNPETKENWFTLRSGKIKP